MNKPRQRVQVANEEEKAVLDALLAQYASGLMEKIYEALRSNEKVKWKTELRQRLGI